MRLKPILLSALAVAVGIGAIGGIALNRTDLNTYYKGAMIDLVARATGRTLVIGGELKLTLLPVPALTVRDVALSNPGWAKTPHMVEAGELSAQIALLPLLFSGKLNIDRLVLKDVAVRLATDVSGRGNWQFDPPGQSAAPLALSPPAPASSGGVPEVPSFGEIALRNIAVTYDDGPTGKTTAASLAELSISGSAAGPMTVKAAATYQTQPITVAATIGELSSLTIPGRPYAINADISVAGATAKVIGSMAEPLAGRGLDFTVSLDGQDLGGLGALFDVQAPNKPYHFSAIVSGDAAGTVTLTTLRAAIGTTTFSGEARLAMNGPRPRLGATLVAAAIDLGELQGPTASTPTVKRSGADDRVFAKDPLPLSALRVADADITLNAEVVKGAGFTLQKLSAHLMLDDRTLQLRPFSFDLGDGHVAGNAELSARQAPAVLTIGIDARHLDFGRLLFQLSGSDLLAGRGDLAITAHGSGDSIRAVMASLDGTSDLTIGRGLIKNRYVNLVGADVFREAFAWTQGKQDSKLTCMVSRFDIRNGLATSRDLLVDTDDVIIVGEGTVNLASERLDLELTPRPKDISLLSLAMPIDIGGTFTRPSFQPNRLAMAKDVAKGVATWVNPLFALLPLVLDGTGDKTPCLAAIEKRGNGAGRDDVAGRNPKGEGGISGTMNGLGQRIESLFK